MGRQTVGGRGADAGHALFRRVRPGPVVLGRAALILAGGAFGSVLLLARNLALARLVPVADYGIAATFALTAAVAEMVSALGLPQQLMRHPRGEDPAFQAALQGLHLLRALLGAALLFVLAGPIAAFFGLPELAWAYRLLALVPLCNGLVHFDIHRHARQLRHGPAIATNVASLALSLAAMVPAAAIWGDYRIMLLALPVQAAAAAAVSHALATRRYRLRLDRETCVESWRFGLPILLNGALLYLVFNGERLIVARVLGMEALAGFALAFTLTLTPTLVLERAAQTHFLPQLSRRLDRPAEFRPLAAATFQAHFLFAALLPPAAIVIGVPLVSALLGPRYDAALPLLAWLAIVQSVRLAKGGSSTVALAAGDSGNGLVANLLRAALMPAGWLVLQTGAGLDAMIAVAILAEGLGFALALRLALRRLAAQTAGIGASLRASVLVWLMSLGGAGGWAMLTPAGPAAAWSTAGLGAAALVALLATIAATDLRRHLRNRPTAPAARRRPVTGAGDES